MMKLQFEFLCLLMQGFSCFDVDCLKWYSSLDGIYRHHCYWYKRSTNLINAFEANRLCAEDGHGLAPYIDIEQYNFMEELRPSDAGETFIGVIDVAEEDTWTHLDGSSIKNNDFWSTFWVEGDLDNQQPNGGSDQNCAAINSKSYNVQNKTQDKSCTEIFRDEMLCYKKEENCLKWNSTADQQYREHCYWFTSKPSSLTSWTVVDAMNQCRNNGGYLAPIIDNQNYKFIMNDVLSTVFLIKSTQVWLGTHSITGSPSNWNNDPSFVTSLLQSSYSEKCVVINSNLIQSWIPCKTNSSALTGAVCFKHESCGLDPMYTNANISRRHPTYESRTYKSEPEKSNVNMNPTTVETNVNMNPTTFEKNVNMNPTTFEKNVNMNPTTVEKLRRVLLLDPKHTNAYKLTKISVYEDRPTAKAIGYVGVVVLISVIVLIVLLDCQRTEQSISKKKTS